MDNGLFSEYRKGRALGQKGGVVNNELRKNGSYVEGLVRLTDWLKTEKAEGVKGVVIR